MRRLQNQRVLAGILTAAMVLSASTVLSFASGTPGKYTSGPSVSITDTTWEDWVKEWGDVSSDYEKVSIAPGADETQMNFAWYSKVEPGFPATPVLHWADNEQMENAETFTGTFGEVDQSLTADVPYFYNHVTVTGLQAGKTYYYTIEKNGVKTEPKPVKTAASFDESHLLFIGDPQIGASNMQVQNGEELKEEDGIGNTAARNDAFNFYRTLDIATRENPDASLIVCAGDQVQQTGQPKEDEYAGLLNATALQSMPFAATIGNHDALNPDFSYHFNTPNATEYGETEAGGDYYYAYGEAVFVVLNLNDFNCAEHEKAIQEALAAYPDAKWRIVTVHQDLYGTSNGDDMLQRTQLTPIFDQYDIDVVLEGHSHTYCRTNLLESDAQPHMAFVAKQDPETGRYDTNTIVEKDTGAEFPLYPEDGDTEGQAAKQGYLNENDCYVMQVVDGDEVTDPTGTLYVTANSSSGSSFYSYDAMQQNYIYKRSQNWLPCYSTIDYDADSFTIATYEVTMDGTVQPVDEAFTIRKTTAADTAKALCSLSGDVALSDAAGKTFEVKADQAPAICAGSQGATVDLVKAWDAETKVGVYRVRPLQSGSAAGIYADGKKLFTVRNA